MELSIAMRTETSPRIATIATVIVAGQVASLCAADGCIATFHTLQVDSIWDESFAYGVSPDGLFVAGQNRESGSCDGGCPGWRWHVSGPGGAIMPPNLQGWSFGASLGGKVLVGSAVVASNLRPFRWSLDNGFAFIPFLPGANAGQLWDVSADGTISVGYMNLLGGRGVRLTPQGIETLLPLPGQPFAEATAISHDGTTVVGRSYNNSMSSSRPVRWVNGATSAELLGPFPAPIEYARAEDVSADGKFVVGTWDANNGIFRWSAETGYQILPFERAFSPSISGDGSVVIGEGRIIFSELDAPIIWDEVNGPRRFVDALADWGVSLPGWTVKSITDISSDGRTIVGWAQSPNGQGLAFAVVRQTVFGDLTDNCVVDSADLGVLLKDWGKGESVADLDDNGVVDGADLSLLLSAWSIPEA